MNAANIEPSFNKELRYKLGMRFGVLARDVMPVIRIAEGFTERIAIDKPRKKSRKLPYFLVRIKWINKAWFVDFSPII